MGEEEEQLPELPDPHPTLSQRERGQKRKLFILLPQPELEAAGRFVSEQVGLRRPTSHLRDLVPPYE